VSVIIGDEVFMNNERSKYKLIDLFAGAGGLSNGFEQTGRFEVVGAVEINNAAVQTYVKNHNENEDIIIKPKNHSISDIVNINFTEFLNNKGISGSETIVIGGPPCQGFSNANRQKNYLISGNNQLVKEYARAIEEIKPIAFLMENVKGMSSEIHKFFVTESADSTNFLYSSEEHLSKITKHRKVKEGNQEIWKDDSIILIKTEYLELKCVFKKIKELDITEPIIGINKLFSRMKKIRNESKKASTFKLKTEKEIKEITQLITYLEERLKCNLIVDLEITSILTQAIDVFKEIKDKAMNKENILDGIGPLIDLNQFLNHLKEMKDEKIIERKPLHISFMDERIEAKAYVKSYNVVEYLTEFFTYLGYDIDYKVLNASNFGVPQNRERFMILGLKKDKLNQKKVELPDKLDNLDILFTTGDAISDLEHIPPQHKVNSEPVKYDVNKQVTPLQKYYRSTNDDEKIYNHVNTDSREMSLKRFKAIKQVEGKNFHSLSKELKDNTYSDSTRTQNTIYLRLNYNQSSPTVMNVRKSMWNHPKTAVALSIREAARLQSFKDNFIFRGTKDQQYQQVGNAVPPLLARGVAETILKLFGDKPKILILDELNITYLQEGAPKV
jgi:DNA (cytosine-5)-methyltransferase 1